MASNNSTIASSVLRNIPTENAIAGTVIAVTSLIGILANVTAIGCTLRMKSTKFTTIFVSLACGDTGVLLVYLLWVAPILYTASELAFDPIAISIVNFLVNTPFFASGYSALVMAVNRYIAVYRPQKYAEMYEPRKMKMKIGACWIVAACGATVYAMPNCGFYVDPLVYNWVYPPTACGWVCNLGIDAIPNVSIFIISSVISLVTYSKLRRIRHSRVENAASVPPTTVHDEERRTREVAFVLQTCSNCCIFVFMMFLFHAVAPFCTGKWGWFWVNTFSWNVCHAINGIIYLFLIPDIRRQVFRFFRIKSAAPHVGTLRRGTATAGGLLVVRPTAGGLRVTGPPSKPTTVV